MYWVQCGGPYDGSPSRGDSDRNILGSVRRVFDGRPSKGASDRTILGSVWRGFDGHPSGGASDRNILTLVCLLDDRQKPVLTAYTGVSEGSSLTVVLQGAATSTDMFERPR